MVYKTNVFQKLAFFIYSLIIIVLFGFLVPYRTDFQIFHKSIFSQYGSIVYLRFLIYLSIPTICLFLSFNRLEKLNNLEEIKFKKLARREFYIFNVFVFTVLITFVFLFVLNKYSEIKKEEYESVYKNILSKKRGNHVVFNDEYLMDNKVFPLEKEKHFSKEFLELKSVTREKLYHTKDNLYVRESEYTSWYSDFYNDKFYSNYQQLINNEIFEVKYEENIAKNEKVKNIKSLIFFDEDEIIKYILISFFMTFTFLYIIRVFFIIYKTILEEIK